MVNTEMKLIVFFAAKYGEPLYKSFVLSTKTRRGPDRGSDHELLIAKFRLKLKKGRKTTIPFKYYLNLITYTVEVTNRFKRLDLIDNA